MNLSQSLIHQVQVWNYELEKYQDGQQILESQSLIHQVQVWNDDSK